MKNEKCRRMCTRLPRYLFYLAVIFTTCCQGTFAAGKVSTKHTYHISHIAYCISHIAYHILHTTYHIKYMTYYISLTYFLSHITYQISHIAYHISHITSHVSAVPSWMDFSKRETSSTRSLQDVIRMT